MIGTQGLYVDALQVSISFITLDNIANATRSGLRWFVPLYLPFVVLSLSTTMALVPNLSKDVEQGGTSLANIWNHALRNQKNEDGSPLRSSEPGPKTIISPNPFLMMNLVPQDGPHPLYSNKYEDFRTEFLLDYMVGQAISPDDPAMTGNGLSVTNLSGKSLNFKKSSDGKITIEGQNVEESKELSDGTVLYQISGFLFGHRDRVQEALEVLRKETPRYGPMGRPLNMPMPPKPSE